MALCYTESFNVRSVPIRVKVTGSERNGYKESEVLLCGIVSAICAADIRPSMLPTDSPDETFKSSAALLGHDQMAPGSRWAGFLSQKTRVPVYHRQALVDLFKAVNLYGNVPTHFPPDRTQQ